MEVPSEHDFRAGAASRQAPSPNDKLRAFEDFFAHLFAPHHPGSGDGETNPSDGWQHALFHTAHDAVFACLLQPDGTLGPFLEANEAACEHLGYTREALRGLTPYEVIDAAETVLPAPTKTLAERRCAVFEADFVARDGRCIPMEVRAQRFSLNGHEAIISTCRDVSERRRAETAQARLAAIVESSDDAIIGKTVEGTITSWNAGAERIYGYTAREAIGQPIALIVPEDRHGEIERIHQSIARGERVAPFETIRRTKDGRLIHTALSVSPIRDADGTIVGASAIARDITPRKTAEEELRRSRAELQDFVENATLGLHWVGPDGTILWANRAELEMLGYTREEYIGRNIAEFHADQDVIEDILWRLTNREELHNYEARLRTRDGAIRHVLISSNVYWDGDEFIHTRCFTRDITERKEAEQALAEREASYRALVQALPDALFVLSDTGVCLDFIPAAGFRPLVEPEDFLGRSVTEVLPPALGAQVLDALEEVRRTGTLYEFEYRLDLDEGRVGYYDARLVPRGDGQVLGIVRDVTERWRTEEQLRSEYVFRQAIEASMPAGVAVADLDGRQTYVNPAFCELVGWSEDQLVGQGPPYPYWPPEEVENIQRAFEATLRGEAPSKGFELRFLRPTGERFDVLVAVAPLTDRNDETEGFLASVTDISERTAAEAELRDSMELFRQLVLTSPAALYTTDREGRVTLYNDRAVELWGRAPVLGQDQWCGSWRIFTPDGTPLPLDACPMAVSLKEQRSLRDQEIVVERPDGTRAFVRANPEPLRNAAGELVGAANTLIDVSDLKVTEATLRAKTHTLTTINEINTSLAAQLDLEKLVQSVTDAGTELSGAQFGAFFYNVIRDEGEAYMLYALSGVSHTNFEHLPMPRNTAIFAPTFDGEGIVRLDDVTQDPRYGHNTPFEGMPAGHLPVRSYLAVPVIGHDGEVLGGLFFGHEEVGVFTAQTEEVIVGIAAQAAIAIENARLYEAARRELAERKKAEALVSAQKLVLERIAQGAPLGEVLDLLTTTLEAQAEGDLLASILLLDEAGRHLQHGSAPSLPAAYNEAIDGIEIGEGVGSCGTAAHRAEVVVVSDIAEDPLWKDFSALALSHDLRACWSTPLLDTQGRVLGTFALYYHEPREPSESDRHLVSIMTRTAAIAIERQRAEQRLRELNETLEQKVAQRTAAFEEANVQLTREVAERRRAEQELEEANIQLRQRNRELQDFAYAASHDLQEPLRKISAFSNLMCNDYGEELDEQGRHYLDRMQQAALRMSGLIKDLLAFSRVATQGRAFEPVTLEKIIEGVLSDLEFGIDEAGGRIEVGTLPKVEADPVQMRQLFQNLIGNAVKFRKEGVPPVVQVRGRIEKAKGRSVARLEVEDNGIGFDEKYRERIFSPFQRLHGRSKYPGSGIGLALCRRILERHGGTIDVRSAPGEGSCFIMTLPLQQAEDRAPTKL